MHTPKIEWNIDIPSITFDLKLAIFSLVKEIPALLENVKLLMTIPGVGEDSAIGIMSEVVDVLILSFAEKISKMGRSYSYCETIGAI